MREKGAEFKVFFGHRASSRPAWTIVVGFKKPKPNPYQTKSNQKQMLG